jgi:hypothetical protein
MSITETLSPEQLQRVWYLSDTVLYNEAVQFVHKLIETQGCEPLPTSQVTGLMNIARTSRYSQLRDFVIHQRERNWPPRQRSIKTFYDEFDKLLTTMHNRRLRSEFHLLSPDASIKEMQIEADLFMAQLASEFIQHLVAENNVLLAEQNAQRPHRSGRR